MKLTNIPVFRYSICVIMPLILFLVLIATDRQNILQVQARNDLFLTSTVCPDIQLYPTTINLDGVDLELCSLLNQSTEFMVSTPTDPFQIATAVNYKPVFWSLSIITIPLEPKAGKQASNLLVTLGEQLQQGWTTEGGIQHPGPTAMLFGQTVTSTITIVDTYFDAFTTKPGLITEWLVNTEDRLWLVRATQELNTQSTDFFTDEVQQKISLLQNISVNSSNPDAPSESLGVESEPLSSLGTDVESLESDLPFPSWWNGVCDTVNYHAFSGRHAYPLGSISYRGVRPCGPRPHFDNAPNRLVHFFTGAHGQFEWQCVELSMRFMYLAYGINPYQGNGVDVVPNYSGSRLERVNNGTTGKSPRPGDIISYREYAPWGHTSVVVAANVNSQGNGSITIMEQNASASGQRSHTVSNWTVNDAQVVTGWLTERSSPPPPSDNTRPDGDYYSGEPNRGGWYNSNVNLRAWAQDVNPNASGVDRVLFRAYYSGSWRTIRTDNTNCSGTNRCDYSYTWNLSNVPDGQVTMGLDVRDQAGNWALTPRGTFIINKFTDPPPSISFNQANGISVTSNGQQIHSNNPNWTFSGTATDNNQVTRVEYVAWGNNSNQSANANGTTTWNYTRNNLIGHNRIHFYAYDNRNQRSGTNNRYYIDLYVDTAPPQTTHNLSGTQGQNGWYRSAVQVSLSASDFGSGNTGSTHNIPNHYRSGVQFVRYRINNGNWQQASGSNVTVTVNEDGEYTFQYYAVDNVGNTETPRTINFRIDSTPPNAPTNAFEIHGVISDLWQRDVGTPSFGWSPATDNLSGIAGYQLYWGPEANGTGALWRGVNSFNPDPVPTGSYYLRARSRDLAGNWSIWNTLFVFKYDGTPPHNPSVFSNDGIVSGIWQNQVRTANFSWSTPPDAGSGVAGYYIYWGPDQNGTSSTFYTANNFISSTPICELDEACIYYLRLQTKDHVGWTADWVTGFVLQYDNAPPTVSIVANYGLPANQRTINLDIMASDEGSGVQQMRLSNEGTNWTNWLPYTTPVLWELPTVGRREYRVMIQVTDAVPNASAIVSDTVMLDVNLPQPGSENYKLWINSLNAGGNHSNSNNYILHDSVGQTTDTSLAQSTNYRLQNGYQAGSLAEPIIIPPYTQEYVQTHYIIASGGTGLGSNNYQLHATIGQPAHNIQSSSTNFQIISGYWAGIGFTAPALPPPPPPAPPPPDCDFYLISIDEGALYTNQAQATLNLCAPDAVEMRLSNDGGFADAPWQSYSTTLNWTLDVYGAYVIPRYVYVHYKDAAGQIRGTFFDDIIYDPTPPQGSITINAPNAPVLAGYKVEGMQPWQQIQVVNNSDVELVLNATDDNSGVWEMLISEDPTFAGATWQPYSAFTTWSVSPEDGIKTIYARFRDRAMNESILASETFILDTTPPIADVSIDHTIVGMGSISVTVSVEATDNLGEVVQMRSSYLSDFSDTNWIPYNTSLHLPVTGLETLQPILHMQFRDESGNESSVYTKTYAIDIEPPIGYAEVEPGEESIRNVRIYAWDGWDYRPSAVEIWLSPDYSFEHDVTVMPYQPVVAWDFTNSPAVYIILVDAAGNFSDRISAVLFDIDDLEDSQTYIYLPIVIRP